MLLKRGLLFSHITNPFSFPFYCVILFHLFTSISYRTIVVVKASNIDEAMKLAEGCPILLHRGNVEVRSIIPMNG
jgi:hypothetical protein